MSAGYVLAIDQGTTGSTVLIFDHDGQIRGRAYSEFTPVSYTHLDVYKRQ